MARALKHAQTHGQNMVTVGSRLRPAFLASTVSYDPNHVRISWKDGKQSIFPNAWLRGAVRDGTYYNENTLLYDHDKYPQFLCNNVPVVSAELEMDNINKKVEDIKIKWQDNKSGFNHTTKFNLSWLRSQDNSINDTLYKDCINASGQKFIKWDNCTQLKNNIMYDFEDRHKYIYDIMTNIKQYGLVYFKNVPLNKTKVKTADGSIDEDYDDVGLERLVNCIGQLRQRFHPTNVLKISIDSKNSGFIDKDIYTSDNHPWHCDTTYYSGRTPARLSVLLNNEYDISQSNFETYNYFVDSITMIDDLKRENNDIYNYLTKIPVRLARRRMNVQEVCSDDELPIYYYDSSINRKLIFFDEKEQCPALFWSLKHAGIDLNCLRAELGGNVGNVGNAGNDVDNDLLNKIIKEYYDAFLYFENNYLNNKKYRQEIILKPGMAAMFSNYRIVHCRSEVHPLTTRSLSLGFVSDDVYYNRWRILNGDKSGLHDKWLYGCNEKQLQILAQRFF